MGSYEHKLERELEQISQDIEERGLSRYKEELLARRQPALKIHLEPNDQLPVGCSKFGGKPDLPPDFPYPTLASDDATIPQGTPLTFLVQYRLQDFAPFSFARELLPSDGMLYFFGLGVEYNDIYLGEGGRVMYWHGDMATLQPYEVGEGTYTHTYKQAKLGFEAIWSWGTHLLRYDFGIKIASDAGNHDLDGGYRGFLDDLWDEGLGHQLLGLPLPQQPSNLMDDEKTLKDFVLLLQLDCESKLGMNLGDAGTLYYLVPAKDLRECVFENLWFEGACG